MFGSQEVKKDEELQCFEDEATALYLSVPGDIKANRRGRGPDGIRTETMSQMGRFLPPHKGKH